MASALSSGRLSDMPLCPTKISGQRCLTCYPCAAQRGQNAFFGTVPTASGSVLINLAFYQLNSFHPPCFLKSDFSRFFNLATARNPCWTTLACKQHLTGVRATATVVWCDCAGVRAPSPYPSISCCEDIQMEHLSFNSPCFFGKAVEKCVKPR